MAFTNWWCYDTASKLEPTSQQVCLFFCKVGAYINDLMRYSFHQWGLSWSQPVLSENVKWVCGDGHLLPVLVLLAH